MHIYDLHTGERRKAVLDDVVQGVRLVDALPNLDFVMSMFLPFDVPEETYERHQMTVMLRESTKPIVFVGMEVATLPTFRRISLAMSTCQCSCPACSRSLWLSSSSARTGWWAFWRRERIP